MKQAVVFDAQVRHHDHLWPSGFARGFHGGADFVQVPKRLEHQAVDARFDQRFDLLAEDGPGFIDGDRTKRLQADAQRPDRGSNKGLSTFLTN